MGEGAQGQSQFPSIVVKGDPLKDSLEKLLFDASRVSDLQDKKVQEICCTTKWVKLALLNWTRQKSLDAKFCIMHFYHNYKIVKKFVGVNNLVGKYIRISSWVSAEYLV